MFWLLAACGPQPPSVVGPLRVEVQNRPVLSGCLDSAAVTVEATVDPEHVGRPATFSSGGEVLWTGVTRADLEFSFDWPVGRGDVDGLFSVDTESVELTVPVDVEPAAIPALELGFADEQMGQDEVDVAAVSGPWTDAVDVAVFDALVGTYDDTHHRLGIEPEVVVQRCPANSSVCETLPVQLESGRARAVLADVAADRCAEPDDTSRDLFVMTLTDACGSSTEQVFARLVHDDCDGDGVMAATDCDDEVGSVAAAGDLAVDGVNATEMPGEGGDIVMCGGSYPEPVVFTGDVRVRSVGQTAHLGSIAVEAGHARFENVQLDGMGVPALQAADADSLTLLEVDLQGTLVGPDNGALDVVGGRWVGSTAIQGAAARLSGGALTRVEVVGGNAEQGGGIWSDGALTLANVSFIGGEAIEGGALYLHHTGASVTGVSFEGNRAVWGGAIAAVLEPGQVLEMRPSIIDLEPVRLVDVRAPDGAAVWQSGGALRTILVEGTGWDSERGGLLLQDVSWTESGSTYGDVQGVRGSLALVRGGSAGLQSVHVSGSAPQGFVALEDEAEVVWQTSEVSGAGCGAWIDAGMLASSQMTGTLTVEEVCGVDVMGPFGGSCTASGCN